MHLEIKPISLLTANTELLNKRGFEGRKGFLKMSSTIDFLHVGKSNCSSA